MLLQITIRNYALIEESILDFSPGLNVLTGETGAGKSILLDALQLLLGARSGSESLRDPGKPCSVEAYFSLERVLRLPEDLSGFLEPGETGMMLKREIASDGKSRCYLNRKAVNLSVLRDLGRCLVDFHGQHDEQQIFQTETHRELTDRLAGISFGVSLEGGAQDYLIMYREYAELERAREKILREADGRQRKLDLLKYQIDEIERVKPEENEEEQLQSEKIRLAHAQKLSDITGEILEALDTGDDAASSKIARSFRGFQSWAKIDPEADTLRTSLQDVQAGLEELNRRVRDYRESLSFDEDRLSEVENRMASLEMLKKKYGGSLSRVLEFLSISRSEHEDLINADVNQQDAEKAMQRIKPGLEKAADAITAKRAKASAKLKHEVEKELKDLGMPHARFECRLQSGALGPWGRETVEFFFSPNPGHDLKPLVRVASGGEASRVLLALKKALAEVDQTPTLIFDEIDANIGGRLGDRVGRKMREIASGRQIFLITHLPQIASFAERHFKVTKKVSKSATQVNYVQLEGQARVRELAEMMSGQKESDIAKTHAEAMLKSASS